MSKKEQPNYYAIIPAMVRYDTNLKYAKKFIIWRNYSINQ